MDTATFNEEAARTQPLGRQDPPRAELPTRTGIPLALKWAKRGSRWTQTPWLPAEGCCLSTQVAPVSGSDLAAGQGAPPDTRKGTYESLLSSRGLAALIFHTHKGTDILLDGFN